MKTILSKVLMTLAMACAALGIAISAGLFPSAEPEPVVPVALVPQKPIEASAAPRQLARARAPEASAFVLCGAPTQGASLTSAPSIGEVSRFFTWCGDGYLLFEVDVRGGAPLVNKLVHMPTKLARPGGALLADVTADDTPDLVVAVSPDLGVVHAPGSAVFLAKGRSGGGFEAAFPLLETPVVGLATLVLEPAAKAPELFVLTRGDAAARRQGELIWFHSGPTPLKRRSFPAGLSPRDLRAFLPAPGAAVELLVVASEPGRVLAFNPSAPDTPARSAPFADGQALCGGARLDAALARSTRDLVRVEGQPVFGLSPWYPQASVGRCHYGDLDNDGARDALAVTDAGFIWLRKPGDDGASELVLPDRYRALDVVELPSVPKRALGLAIDTAQKELVLLAWTALPWGEDLSLDTLAAKTLVSAPPIEIPLE